MEKMRFEFVGRRSRPKFSPVLIGVVGSGNLEILVESRPSDGACTVDIITSARGFASTWAAVLRDFHSRHELADVAISINDMGATPAVVSLRLDQAVAEMGGGRESL